MHPRTAMPFVVAHAGGINKDGMQFFIIRRDAADSKPNARASGLSSWSSKRFPVALANFLIPCSHPNSLVLRALAFCLWWPREMPVLVSSNEALMCGNPTQPGSCYALCIRAN